MLARTSPSSPNVLARSALHPPETFPPPTSAPTFRASPKEDLSDVTETTLTRNRSESVPPIPRSDLNSRQYLFEALELGCYFLRHPRPILSADDLDEIELTRCFEILHACHIASDDTATLHSTKNTMGGFLKAVFNGWIANGDGVTSRQWILSSTNPASNRVCLQQLPGLPDSRLRHRDLQELPGTTQHQLLNTRTPSFHEGGSRRDILSHGAS
ncbi:hypothetical protein FLONG3_2878 [Fusarium longipes]|uniref:Uncharacterized protein n=1 Tax=Fusarium longipes TaxID=694270 RepID=A0A395T3R3_9HYPO|nr:hypothetical protein FLONG3_2878 [Fusarium longipes]